MSRTVISAARTICIPGERLPEDCTATIANYYNLFILFYFSHTTMENPDLVVDSTSKCP